MNCTAMSKDHVISVNVELVCMFVRTAYLYAPGGRAPNVVKVNSVCWVRRINGVEEVGVKHGKKTYGIECCWRLEELGGMRGLCLLSVIALLLTTMDVDVLLRQLQQ